MIVDIQLDISDLINLTDISDLVKKKIEKEFDTKVSVRKIQQVV